MHSAPRIPAMVAGSAASLATTTGSFSSFIRLWTERADRWHCSGAGAMPLESTNDFRIVSVTSSLGSFDRSTPVVSATRASSCRCCCSYFTTYNTSLPSSGLIACRRPRPSNSKKRPFLASISSPPGLSFIIASISLRSKQQSKLYGLPLLACAREEPRLSKVETHSSGKCDAALLQTEQRLGPSVVLLDSRGDCAIYPARRFNS